MSILPSPIPHPLDYSPWELPGWVYEALDWVVGVEWPEGDERAVWDLADEWYAVAAALAGPRDDAIAAAAEVGRGYGGVGLVAEAFDRAWRRIADGDDAPLHVLLAVSHDLGRLVEECGCDIEGAKIEVWIELGILVVELVSLAVAAALTAGAASPAAAGAIAATRLVVQQIFRRLLAQLARKQLRAGLKEAGERAAKEVTKGGVRGLGKRSLRGGLEEAAEESGINLATQAYQNSTGRRDGIDLTDLGTSAVGGLAGGAVAPLAGLGRHANSRGGRIAEYLGREMTGETMAEGAASLVTGQGVLSLEDAARAAVSGATGSATGQADTALRARLDGQLGALAAPLPPADLPLSSTVSPPLTPPAATADPPSVGRAVETASVEAPSVGPSSVTNGAGPDPHPTGGGAAPSVSSTAPAPSPASAAAGPQTWSDSMAANPTLSAVTTERPPLLAQPVDSPATGQPPVQPTAAVATTGGVAAAVTASGPVSASSTVPTAVAPGTVPASGALGANGGATVGAPNSVAGASISPVDSRGALAPTHPAATGTQSGVTITTSPSMPRTPPVERIPPAEAVPPQPGAGAATPSARHRFPELEVLAPRPATPPPSDGPPAPRPALPDEQPRPRTPEWYAARWAAEREALERRRYQGYFESQRAWYEDRRREELTTRLRRSASSYLDRAGWLRRRGREFAEAGLTLRAEHMFKASTEAERDFYEYSDWADAVRDGRIVPEQVVIDDPIDFQRINDDVAELAPGAVETADRSGLTWDDRPPPIDRSRPYGRWGGLRPPLALHQTDLERAMPRLPGGSIVRTADPRHGRWFSLANDGGPAADPTRGINCLDCTLSLYETWVHGRPRVSAPRTFDGYEEGDITKPILGERGGPGRVEAVTGGRFQRLIESPGDARPSPARQRVAVEHGYDQLEIQLQLGGHGSYAFLVSEWEDGGSHAWVALNQNGTILYLDPQSGTVRDQPLYAHTGLPHTGNVVGMDVLILGGDGQPMPLRGLTRGRFSTRSDPPDQPPAPVQASDAADAYVNRLHLLDGPNSASGKDSSLGGQQRDVSPAALEPAGTVDDSVSRLTAAERAVLDGLRQRAESVADAVEGKLTALCDRVTALSGGNTVEMRDREFRLKSAYSLAGKFFNEAVLLGMTIEDFAADVNDVLRFNLVLPAGEGYVTALEHVLSELRRDGFHVDDQSCKNFWRAGNRFYGFNCTVYSPGGQVFELQLHTESSRAVWLETHGAYETLRRSDRSPAQRLEALLEMLAVNRRAGMPEAVPSGLELRFPPKDGSFAKWITAFPETWAAYRRLLEAAESRFMDVVSQFGLTRRDFPIAPELEPRMERPDVDLLRSLP
ncbi:hypothetical protein E1193_12010 [Micromonospora sp. KC606]|uniref:toxin glutamine deamidase domain-containing protein n=1 Tax=Micromonospora sp. KC606 TaxID=2530379 RepID=UPI001051E46E|nr:toxin glutamine deamidase domain-containing protein [Micromonospora sp. KC606]TDC82378.1 hypothetical protein E1193_12010 [Micromonospora sp. KC606]